jgi:hypothetical protein
MSATIYGLLPIKIFIDMGDGELKQINVTKISLEPDWVYNGSRKTIDCEMVVHGDFALPNPAYDPNFLPDKPRGKKNAVVETDRDGEDKLL